MVPRMLKLSITDTRQVSHIGNALSTQLRLNILSLLQNRSMNVREIAAALNTSVSTVALNIQILEESGLVHTTTQPAKRGSMKVCSVVYGEIYINLRSVMDISELSDVYVIEMPVGMFSTCVASPTCGMADDTGYIGEQDDPTAFFLPERSRAGTLWLDRGYVEYLLPFKNPDKRNIHSIQVEYEACSEAPGYDHKWKSDISLWVNDVEVGMWQSPGDFGERAGRFSPQYWASTGNSQYGIMNRWMVTAEGTYFFDTPVSDVTVANLIITEQPYIKIRIGVAENAANQGGLCLFGRGFGDYDIGIKLTVRFLD